MATASSSASPSFFDKTFSFLCSFIYFAFPTTTISPLPFSASPVRSPSDCVPLGLREQPPLLPEAFDTLRAESLVGVQE